MIRCIFIVAFLIFNYDKNENLRILTSELRLRPSVVKSVPSARDTKFGSVSAARMKVSSPIIPNWSVTIVAGMFVTIPEDKNVLKRSFYYN